MDYLRFILELAEFAAAIVLAVVPVVIARIQNGKFELQKTLEAAEDVAHAVKDLEEGIQQIEELRGKPLDTKMRRKAEARLQRFIVAGKTTAKKTASKKTATKKATQKKG